MSNILIIKHGSLGDIVQASGVLQDIRNHFYQDTITMLTSSLYKPLFEKCPYIDQVLVDERKPRWNLFYLFKLKKTIEEGAFSQVIDIQNSSRTEFYRKHLFSIANWSSTRTILQTNESKSDFDQDGVLERFKTQLERTGIKPNNTLYPDFSWAADNHFHIPVAKPYIFLSPFSSGKLLHKRWPYYKELIELLKLEYPQYEIVVAPGPSEIENAKLLNANVMLDGEKATNFSQLTKIIQDSVFVVSNDTGPAHMAAHLGCKGLVLFGSHTTAKKVSIETKLFKAYQVEDLKQLSAETVMKQIKKILK